eukprot:TRINITY_DN3969_c0_g1_i2.p1 TRINITY_DN3969_c0_g1~~TRINITY_DN3969_c0_g1_i2.p1  ORF type:complete len:201 (+),score=66.94 TRINITY_DN3969_c0_g1_i2:22-603(+)
MIRRPPRSTHCISSAASDVYKRQVIDSKLEEEAAESKEKIKSEVKREYELEIKGEESTPASEIVKEHATEESKLEPQEELKLEPGIKELNLEPAATLKESRASELYKDLYLEITGKREEHKAEEVRQRTIDRKKLLSTPYKKPPLPRHLSSSIKEMSGANLKDKELERITNIMRESPKKSNKKYYEYSSDSDS